MSMNWGQLGNRLIAIAKVYKTPLFGQFELTARCNLQCKMCYVSKSIHDREARAQERTAKEWIQLAEEAKCAGMLHLMFTGGEVFVRQDFRNIYEEINKMGLITQINTNATLITPEIANWLGKMPPTNVTVTLYGASPETYDKVCGDAGGYQRAIRGIELLSSEGINLKIRTTVVRGNSNDFNELTKLTEKYRIPLNIVKYILPRREGLNSCPEAERLSPQELIQYDAKIEAYYSKKLDEMMDRTKRTEAPSNLPPLPEMENELTNSFHCIGGHCGFSVTWDGRMVPCVQMAEPATSPFDIGFLAAWSKLKELCTYIPECLECSNCVHMEYCMSCPATRKNETGFYDQPVSYLCELIEKKSKAYLLDDIIK